MDHHALTGPGAAPAFGGRVRLARMRLAGLLLAALLLGSCRSYPAGGREQPSMEGKLKVYWVLRGDEASAGMLVERMYLPASLAVLTWTEFSVGPDGVQLESRGGYRVLSRREAAREAVGELVVQTDELSVRLSSAVSPPRGRSQTYTVQFSYAGLQAASSRVIPQPLQEALLRGIRDSGRRSGQARLVSLEYLGAGRFSASVEVI